MDTHSPPAPSVAAADDLELTDLVIDELLTGTGKSLIEKRVFQPMVTSARALPGHVTHRDQNIRWKAEFCLSRAPLGV